MATNELHALRIKSITQNRANRQAERAKLATEFQQALTEELGGLSGSAAQRALLESAVASYVIVTEASRQFQNATSHSKALQRLQLAAGVLRRSLKALGLSMEGKKPAAPARATNNPDVCPPNLNEAERAEWGRQYIRRRVASVSTEKVNG